MAAIILKDVRLAFPDLWKPGEPMPGSTSGPKFGATGIFAPNSEAAKVAIAEFNRVCQEKFGPNWQAIAGEIEKSKKCIRKGDSNLDKAGEVRNGFAGMLYIVAKNKAKPAVVDGKKMNGQWVHLDESSGKPYGGCKVNLKVEIYAMAKPGMGKSVNASLLAVQFVGDGEAFGAAPGTADGFEEEDMGDEAPAASGSADGLFG